MATPTLAHILRQPIGYNAELKRKFHRVAKSALKRLADNLLLPPSAYDLRVNAGGIAVSGEVTLHTDTFYVQVFQSAIGGDLNVLFRTCNGRRDYTGGLNHWATAKDLCDPMEFGKRLSALGRERAV